MDCQTVLGVERPIIQAPMAGVQDSALALAVASAGGLGSLPCGMLSEQALREQLTIIDAQTTRPINLNFFCHRTPAIDEVREARWRALLSPYFLEQGLDAAEIPAVPSRQPFNHRVADIVEAYQPQVVSFHFGLPEPTLLARVKSWGATVLSSATTLQEGLWLQANGADVVIAQGLEAGGHRGMFLSEALTTQQRRSVLLAQLTDKLSIPVIAAGGIADASGVAAVLKQGAIAAQLGTAYLLCPEAKTSALHRAALASAVGETAVTNLFTGRPARGIVNRVMEELGAMRDDIPAYPLTSPAITALRQHAEQQGSSDFSPLWCGENRSGCQALAAAELTRSLVAYK
ncbi:nitronate monooxygenase [Sinobacterium caligoides]|uniref:Nitronate monooxygenase n=1 Tax=Sinobacterium caligoides TaxID=933926 RepID=A0A3N2DK96_9GAMM|nr:nitronate monooxygenase [Sinobacterium caligoides]ROS00230.1 nitronate monooxygenase [Sinobacterium caligoides]